MPETHFKSQPKMPKSTPKSLKAPTFIRSIRSTFSLRRRLGCSSATSIRMSAESRPKTQPNTTNSNNDNRTSKNNGNFMMPKQRKVVVSVTLRNNRRHRHQQFADLEYPPAKPNSTPTTIKCFGDRGIVVAKEDPTRSNQATIPAVTTVGGIDLKSEFRIPRSGTEVFGTSQHGRVPHPSPDELVEILKRQTNLLLGVPDSHDQFRDWRLDTDDMTYEQLLALGDKIGYVSTGLIESEIRRCVKSVIFFNNASLQSAEESEPKCSICQEEYEPKEKLGLLKCTHSYHHDCIKQWLRHKKICPVCKFEVKAWC